MHPNVFIELFDLSHKLTNTVLEELSDVLESNSIRVDKIENFDTRVYFYFSYPTLGALNEDSDAQLAGSLIIDRMRANYEVDMKFNISESVSESVHYTPLFTKDFDEVLRYIALVNENTDELMLSLLPKRAYLTTFNEAVAYDAASNYRQLSLPAREFLVSMVEQYQDGMGTNAFDIASVDPVVIDELLNGGYLLRRGTQAVLDSTAVDSLRSITTL